MLKNVFEKIFSPKISPSKLTVRFTKEIKQKSARNCKNMWNTSRIIDFYLVFEGKNLLLRARVSTPGIESTRFQKIMKSMSRKCHEKLSKMMPTHFKYIKNRNKNKCHSKSRSQSASRLSGKNSRFTEWYLIKSRHFPISWSFK